jgi:hypothetical protein
MTITFEIETDNDAFTLRRTAEVRRIISRWISSGRFMVDETTKILDINGNTVGTVTVKGK